MGKQSAIGTGRSARKEDQTRSQTSSQAEAPEGNAITGLDLAMAYLRTDQFGQTLGGFGCGSACKCNACRTAHLGLGERYVRDDDDDDGSPDGQDGGGQAMTPPPPDAPVTPVRRMSLPHRRVRGGRRRG